MKSKKLLALVLSGIILASALSACSTAKTGEDGEAPTQVVTQAVTDAKGETVTKDNGEAVTELVTDANGDTVTEVVSTTTATTTDKTQTSKPNNTTKSQGTTKPSTTKKVTTTEPEVDNAIEIVLEKNMMASSKSPNVSIAQGEVLIDKPGDYVIRQKTGSSAWHGQIIIKLKNTQEASFRFENVHIDNDSKNIIQIIDSSIKGADRSFLEAEAAADSSLDNAISEVADNEKAPNVSLSFPTGTSSTFVTSANSYTGVIYNESKLTIKGNGSAKITSKKNANNCICTTKSLTVKNVALTLETIHNTTSSAVATSTGSAKGIFSFSKVYLESGFLTIKTNGDAIRCNRFYMYDGTANIKSSACDGIDADNSIIISGGNITSVALKKSSFKVRRVNNTEKKIENTEKNIKEEVPSDDLVRAGREDCFRINGGKVVGESKKITSLDRKYQSDNVDSKQASVLGKIVKLNAGTATSQDEDKAPSIIKIGNWSSKNKCTKFLYSSASVKKDTKYSASANGNSSEVSWNGKAGVALIKNSTNT